MSRQTDDGGFCFYRGYGVEEPNALDAFSAVAGLYCLSAEVPKRAALIRWLRGLQAESGTFPNLPMAWYALETLRLLNARPRYAPRFYLEAERERFLEKSRSGRTIMWSSALWATARLLRLLQRWAVPPLAEFEDAILALLQRLRGPQGGYGWPSENLIDTAEAAAILSHLDVKGPQQWHDFLLACCDGQSGFRLVPASSATSLETLYAGVSAFRLWGRELPEDIAFATTSFIRSCQCADGGFGRTAGAIPTLADTRLALETLVALAKTHPSTAP